MNILHLTDLHFSDEEDMDERLWKKMPKAVRRLSKGRDIDMAAVTGDLTSHGRSSEFAKAREALYILAQELSIPRDRFLFCMGNHDADVEEARSPFTHYEQFLRDFYGREPEGGLYLEKGKKGGKRTGFHIFSTNTCTETSLLFFNDACIPEKEAAELCAREDDGRGILLMHHQPDVVRNQETLHALTDSGKIDLILCGHLHGTETRVFRIGTTTVVNGIAVKPHLSWLPAGFQMIRIRKDGRIQVRSKIFN